MKQADVVLLGYPLQWKGLQANSREADLKYYETRTDVDESSMTCTFYWSYLVNTNHTNNIRVNLFHWLLGIWYQY